MAGKQGGNNSKVTTTPSVAGLHTVAIGDERFSLITNEDIIKAINEFKKDVLKEVASGNKKDSKYEEQLSKDLEKYTTYLTKLAKDKDGIENINGERIPVYRLLREELSKIVGKTFTTKYGEKYIEKYGELLDKLEVVTSNMAYTAPTKSGHGGVKHLYPIYKEEVHQNKTYNRDRLRGGKAFDEDDLKTINKELSKILKRDRKSTRLNSSHL